MFKGGALTFATVVLLLHFPANFDDFVNVFFP